MQLKDVMTRQIERIRPGATLREAAEAMRTLDVGSLPVCENNAVIGMLTDRDIAIRGVAQGRDPNKTQVQDAMSTQVFYCYDDEDVRKAADLMEQNRIRRLPVFDHDQRLRGMVSLGDLSIRANDDVLGGEVLHEVSQPAQQHA